MSQVGHCPLLHHVWLTPHSSAAIGSSNGIYVISTEHGINQPSDQPADIQHLSITVTPAQMLKIRHAVTGSLSLLIYRRYPTGDCFALLLFFSFLFSFLLDFFAASFRCSFWCAIMFTVGGCRWTKSGNDFFSISVGRLA